MSFPSPVKNYHQNTYPAINPARPELSTKGKIALISGGGAGIGASIAVSLAKSGITHLALLGRTKKTLEATKQAIGDLGLQTKVWVYTVDLKDLDSTTSTLDAFTKSVGAKIDILVANAAYMPDLLSITDADPDDWWQGFEVTIRGNFNLLRAFQPRATPDASLIHISSSALHIPYMPGYSAYRASKIAATKVFEYFSYENPGVFVLQVHPGLIIGTTMSEKFGKSALDAGLVPDDITLSGDFVVWAVSNEAKFLNGRFVWANWDVEELQAHRKDIEADRTKFTVGLIGWPDPLDGASR